jgi:4-hydroxyphenylpyruvate dioxygenase-like putative hemolysin
MKIDHLTAIVENAELAASALRRLLGADPIGSTDVAGMKIFTFRLGNLELHVNAPTGEGPVQTYFHQHGASLHHFALAVEDLDATLAELESKGFKSLGSPTPTAPGLREVFIDPATTGGVLIQLVQRDAPVLPEDLDPAAVKALADAP